MLAELGYDSLAALSSAAVPASIEDEKLDLPAGRSEHDVLADLRDLASQHVMRTQLIGQGYFDTITPAVIRRNLVANPARHPAYTPHHPATPQGRPQPARPLPVPAPAAAHLPAGRPAPPRSRHRPRLPPR